MHQGFDGFEQGSRRCNRSSTCLSRAPEGLELVTWCNRCSSRLLELSTRPRDDAGLVDEPQWGCWSLRRGRLREWSRRRASTRVLESSMKSSEGVRDFNEVIWGSGVVDEPQRGCWSFQRGQRELGASAKWRSPRWDFFETHKGRRWWQRVLEAVERGEGR